MKPPSSLTMPAEDLATIAVMLGAKFPTILLPGCIVTSRLCAKEVEMTLVWLSSDA